MIATLAATLVIVLAVALTRWVASVPLIHTLSASIDQWADSVHGLESDPYAD